ncbi:hypothetical protein [Cellulomonas denverensis]|uniref:hypothetical protein n=1 Tax=Cellulomonas denverensis TaxID=264297 RepID=UPI0035EE21E3
MKVRTARAGGALIATMLVAPLGAGVAAAEAAPEPTPAEVSDTQAVEPDAEATTEAAESPAEVAAEQEEAADPAAESGDQVQVAESPAATPAAEATTPTGPAARVAPVGVELNGLTVDAVINPMSQPWHSSGVYSAVLTINDVIGLDSSGTEYPGMAADVTYTYNLNGGAQASFVPAADGTFLVDGLTEGTNVVGLRVAYQNTVGAMMEAAATLSVSPVVLTQAETVTQVWQDTVTPACTYEQTLYQGETVTTLAPAGAYQAGEQITLFVFDAAGVAVDTLTLTAAADGSLSYAYQVPADMVPADYLLYFEGAVSGEVYSLLLHVLELPAGAAVPDPAAPVTVTPVDVAAGTGSLSPTSTLAATGADPSMGLLIGGLATVAGAGMAVGARVLLRRRSQA